MTPVGTRSLPGFFVEIFPLGLVVIESYPYVIAPIQPVTNWSS
jgi:hypothetical protein